MLQDIGFAARMLLRSRGWTAMVVLSLALGIGANTALFSAVNGLALRPLAVEDPGSLVRFRHVGTNQMATDVSEYGPVNAAPGVRIGTTVSYPMFLALRDANQTLTDLFAGAPSASVNVVVDGHAEIATSDIATGNYHQALGARTVLGRTITPDDDMPAAPPVAVLSHAFWTRRFGRDQGVLGKVIRANGVPVTIVGVLSADFNGIQRVVGPAPDLSFPLALDPRVNMQAVAPGEPPRLERPTYWWLQVAGRLKPGITAEQVEGNFAGLFQQMARDGFSSFLASLPAEARDDSQNRDRTQVPQLQVTSAARGLYDANPSDLRMVTLLTGVVVLILLIVCANVANLQLSRAAARQREISVRLSLGATRLRLVRQLLTESVVLALAGAGAGLLVAGSGRSLLPGTAGQAPIDWRVVAFTGAIAIATGVLFGLAPALKATRSDVGDALKQTSRTVAGGRTLLGKSLLVVQVAIGLMLLIGAGLFLRTVDNLRRVDVGFNPHHLVLFRLNPQLNGYEPQRIGALYDRVTERLQALPGIRAVTLSNPPLLSGNVASTNFVVQGRAYTRGPHNNINRVRVAANFFEAMEMPIVAGRGLTDRDVQGAPLVAVINEAAARRFFPEESPLGRRFGQSPETSGQIEVVGVVRDAKYNSVRDAAPATMYTPYRQAQVGPMAYEVRTAGDPAAAMGAIREAVRQVDANVPLTNVTTQTDQIEMRFAQERLFAKATTIFGGLALLIASIGLLGLMSYSVARRTNEIGVRMALGAERRDVVRMVMRESLTLVAIGLAVGVVAALASGRLITSMLFGVGAADVTSIALAIVATTVVSGIAGYIPARRAARVEPIVALRYE